MRPGARSCTASDAEPVARLPTTVAMIDLPLLALMTAVLLVAGTVKGIMGLGLPTISVALLGLVMPPMQAAAIVVIPTFLTNVWQAVAGPSLAAVLRRLWPMFLGIVAGTWVGGELMARADGSLAKGCLGLALALYALLGLTRWSFSVPRRAEPWLTPPMGLATGVANGATGLFIVPGAPYVQSLGLGKDELVQSLGGVAVVASLALGIVLWTHDMMTANIAGLSLFALLPSFAGMFVGQAIRAHVSQDLFRRLFFVAMLLLGGYYASRMLAG